MFKTIVVSLDGSAFAEAALPVAEALAAETGAELAVVRVVELVAPGDHEPGVVSYLDEHRIATAQEYVNHHAACSRLGRALSADAYLAPDAATGILARAADIGADVIIMTTHGASWPESGSLGSVALRVTRESVCPVMLVGPRLAAGDATGSGAAGVATAKR